MAESPVVGIRIPPELLREIDSLVGTVGKNRTEVVLTLIKISLGLETRKDTAFIIQRVGKLEKKPQTC